VSACCLGTVRWPIEVRVRSSLFTTMLYILILHYSACRTCMKRRIKCDRSTPHCQKCAARGLQCPGYPQSRLRWAPVVVADGIAEPRCENAIESQTSSSDSSDGIHLKNQSAVDHRSHALSGDDLRWADRLGTATLSVHLLHHFLHDTVRRLVWLDGYSNPWRTYIWPLSERSPLLRLCLMTLATAHIAAISGREFDKNIYRDSQDASLRALSHGISDGMLSAELGGSRPAPKLSEACSTEVAAGIITLCYGDLFIKHTTDQAIHLQACRVVIDTGLILQEQTGHVNETLQFVVCEAQELETTAHVFSFHHAGKAPSTSLVNRTSFWTFTGFIQEVTAAERELYVARQNQGNAFPADLDGWISKLDSARNSIYAANWSGFVCANHTDGQLTLGKVINVNYLACLIYIHQSILPEETCSSHLRSAISSLMNDLQDLCSDPHSLNQFAHDVYWPLFIAGTVSWSCSVSQAAVRRMFMQSITKSGYWCNYDALRFLEIFWASAASEDSDYDRRDWLDFARKQSYQMLSFIVF